MTCTSPQQHEATWYVEPGNSPHTFDGSSERWEFVTENFAKVGTSIPSQMTLGTRWKDVAQYRHGTYSCQGDIVVEPSPTFLNSWLPRILGANEVATDTFGVAETLQWFGMFFNRGKTLNKYSDCVVNRATFRGTQNQPIQLTLNIIGKTKEASAGSEPSVTLAYADASEFPYVFTDTALSLAGTTRSYSSFELVIDNAINARFNNSTTATSLCPGKSSITLRATLDPNATAVEGDLSEVAEAGIAGVFTWTNGTVSTTWTFGKLVKADSQPTFNTVGGLEFDVEFEAMKNDATPIVSVVNDITV